MTLVSDIIRDAYRESNLIAITADPTTAEQTEGLKLLNRHIALLYGTKVGEEFEPLSLGGKNVKKPAGYDTDPDDGDWFVPANTRLMLNLEEATTVYLDPNPEDGARFSYRDLSNNLATHNLTLYGNGRTIADSTSVVVSTNGASAEYVYRADTGNWAVVTPLIAADTFPFPSEFEDLFIIRLAMRLNPRHGVMLDQQSIETYNDTMKAFKARYRQHREVHSELALLNLVGTRRGYFDGSLNARDFNIGRPR